MPPSQPLKSIGMLHHCFIIVFLLLFHAHMVTSLDKVEIFYVNLPQSKTRNLSTQKHLQLLGHPYERIEAINISTPQPYNLTQSHSPCSTPVEPLLFEGSILNSKYIQLNNLCIHPSNFMKEIAVTLSHIKALLAILSSDNNNPYAIVIEDDMEIAFHLDLTTFASQFPSDFGIIQLFVMNPYEQVKLLRRHKRNKIYMNWLPLFWSTGGYLVNKINLRLHLEKLLVQEGNEVFHLDLIAGSDRIIILGQDKTRRRKLCWPKQCCDGHKFIKEFPCVLTPHGVAADYYIYSIVHSKTYVSTFPILTGTVESYVSTVSNNHTSDDIERILHLRRYIRDIYNGLIPLPMYAKLRTDSFADDIRNTN